MLVYMLAVCFSIIKIESNMFYTNKLKYMKIL